MITVECHAGVLIELRFAGTATVDDAVRFKAETAALIKQLWDSGGRRVSLCTDLRETQMFAPEVANEIIEVMRTDNPRVERNGILGNESALLTLQVQRLLFEAGSQGRRRVFTQVDLLVEWLGSVLTDVERERLLAFLEPRGTSLHSPPR